MNKESSEQIQPQTRVLEEERPPAQELDQPEASDELPIPTAGPKPVVGSEQTGKELTNTASDKVSPSPWRPIGAVTAIVLGLLALFMTTQSIDTNSKLSLFYFGASIACFYRAIDWIDLGKRRVGYLVVLELAVLFIAYAAVFIG